jgi:hypothetical protein
MQNCQIVINKGLVKDGLINLTIIIVEKMMVKFLLNNQNKLNRSKI